MSQPRIKGQMKQDMHRLITLITGFSERDENFGLCVQFMESNLKYHRFLSPDSHKIDRTVNGLCEKLEVHSQTQKARDLRELTAEFLNTAGLEGRDHGKTESHYALLLLLLELAESPIQTEFTRRQPELEEEKIDDFDWGAYLLDSEDLNFMSYASSDTDEEEEEALDSDEEKLPCVTWKDDTDPDKTDASADVIQADLVGDASLSSVRQGHSDVSSQNKSFREDEYAFLERTLVVQYWQGKGREEDLKGSHSASNLARDWDAYQRQTNQFYTPGPRVIITETQVMRETLWMLSGIQDLFIFTHNGQEFGLNPQVSLSHLTNESLSSAVRPLMRKANQVWVLQSFVDEVSSQVCHAISCEDDTCVPQTYQVFANCVSQFLADFQAWLVEAEKKLMKQEELMSLSKLTSDLCPWMSKVQAVHSVYILGVAGADSVAGGSRSNAVKATLLLNVLYRATQEWDLMTGLEGAGECALLLKMLIKSSKPLIDIASHWISNGELLDPMSEFVVQRNKEVKSLDETFWEKAFVSNMTLNQEEQASMQMLTSSKNETTQTKSRSVGQSLSQTCGANPVVSPLFLQAILSDAILTGKSMEMFENLGRLGEVLQEGCSLYERPPSLYSLFLADLKAKLAPHICSGGRDCENQDNETKELTTLPSQIIQLVPDRTAVKQLNGPGERDALLNLNFKGLLENTVNPRHCQLEQAQTDFLDKVTLDPVSLLRLCEDCLGPHVRSRYSVVCRRLVDILNTEYRLLDCIHAMQKYYLMSSGEVMYDFYTPIFSKIDNKENWRDFYILDMFLHEAIAKSFPEDLPRLSVMVVTLPRSQEKRPINATDCIQLKYQVPWPADVVISGQCQELYNQIFTYLMQIKRAKSTLDLLRYEDLSNVPSSHGTVDLEKLMEKGTEESMPRLVRVHRCQLLRFRLLYFINSLHNYIMTRILHSTGVEFESELHEATDLQQIIDLHRRYVESIHECCMLSKKMAVLREAVVRVLNLALTLAAQWRQGVDFILGESIEEQELEFSRCLHFLSSFLNNVIKRGSFPHLESLAFVLDSSRQMDAVS